jgi:uncharacterized membrane protein
MGQRWGTSRTEAFSDGVFAIAITLLVLDLNVPDTSLDNLWSGILHEWPSYLAYTTSFLTIGAVWLAHHGLFARLRYVDRTLMRFNLLLLMVVAFLPYPTRLVAEAIRNEDAERAAVIFYGLTLFAISFVIAVMWRVVAAKRDLLEDEVGDAEVDAILRATTPDPGVYVAVIVVGLLAPRVAAFGYLVASVVLVLRARGEEHTTGQAPASG